MPTMARPDVDVLDGLTTAILVDQERMGANPRSTVGTATDANAMLRILFSRLGKPHIGSPQAFSFNVASISGAGRGHVREGRQEDQGEAQPSASLGGMCPRCEGTGRGQRLRPDRSSTTRPSRSTRARITIPGYSMDGWYGRIFRGCGFFDPDKPIKKFTKKELDDLLYKEPTKIKVEGINLTYVGLIPQIQKSFLSKDVEAMQPHIRAFVERAITFTTCPECDGTRLSEAARSSKIDGRQHRRRLRDADQRPRRLGARPRRAVGGAAAGGAAARPSTRSSRSGSATSRLDRPSGTLSGGEAQRDEDDPPPRLVAHRRHLRLRRADHRAAPARHPADERAAAAAAGQGQHRARRRAQARGDRDRRPRRRPRARRRDRRRRGRASRAPSTGCGRAARSPGATSTTGPPSRTRCARRPARSRSAAPTPTTSRTSTSTSRSACWSSSPAWPARARAR